MLDVGGTCYQRLDPHERCLGQPSLIEMQVDQLTQDITVMSEPVAALRFDFRFDKVSAFIINSRSFDPSNAVMFLVRILK